VEIGLDYAMNRYYATDLGRFISEDPARDGSNWYAYCNNNPMAFVDPTGLDVGNTGNAGWDEEGNTQVIEAKTIVDEQGGPTYTVYEESDSNRGLCAQRTEGQLGDNLTGEKLVTQKDLESLVNDADQACFVLSLFAGPQVEKSQYLTKSETARLIINYIKSGALTEDLNVEKPNVIENDIAKMLGYSFGSVGVSQLAPPTDAQAVIRIRLGDDHYNLGDSSGNFRWESWNGGDDRIKTPYKYRGLYFN